MTWARLICTCCLIFIIGCTKTDPRETVRHTNTFSPRKSDETSPISFSIIKPVDLNKIDFQSALAVRAEELKRVAQFFESPYSPSSKVFDGVDPNGKWVSLGGFYYVGPVPTAHIGYSFESLPLLNPMLVLAGDFSGSSIATPGRVRWTEKNPKREWIDDPGFPFAPVPKLVSFFPETASLTIEYDLSSFSRIVEPYLSSPLEPFPTAVSFSAFNAHDLGFQTVKVLPEKSLKIDVSQVEQSPQRIVDRVQLWKNWFGSSEGYNHRSKYLKNLTNIPILETGAVLSFGLWHKIPAEISAEEPDLVVTITFS